MRALAACWTEKGSIHAAGDPAVLAEATSGVGWTCLLHMGLSPALQLNKINSSLKAR